MDLWQSRFFDMCKLYATYSKDPSRKIGAVAVDPEKRIVLSSGYNGFPRNIIDSDDRLQHRETKYRFIVHAEMNAIYNATYNGISLDGSHVYVYGLPVCSECAKGIIQVGVKKVLIYTDEVIPATWLDSWSFTRNMFDEAGVTYQWFDNT